MAIFCCEATDERIYEKVDIFNVPKEHYEGGQRKLTILMFRRNIVRENKGILTILTVPKEQLREMKGKLTILTFRRKVEGD